MVPPHLDKPQQKLYDNIVDTRIKIVGKDALFDEAGGLRGPWNPQVASPALGQHLERLATAVRSENSLEARLYEVAILVVGVQWQAQFEWYAHEKIARKAGVAEAAFPLMKVAAPADKLVGILEQDEVRYRSVLVLFAAGGRWH
jgi:4-carboxymuconolactone decarboxylase